VEPLLQILAALVLLGVIGWLIAIAVGRFVTRVTVHDYERGLRFVQGRFTGLADAGTHVVVRPTTELRVIDVRPSSITIGGQEVITSDGVAVKISLVVRSVIGDPVAWFTADQDAGGSLYLAVQLGLREVVAGRTIDEILAARTTIGPEIAELAAARVAEIGIELIAVDVRDVMVPAELKRASASIVAARHEGAAALERARGETAALRSLANAGRLVADNPGLLSLRVVQELGARGGNTIMLGLGDGSAGAAAGRPSSPSPPATRARSSGRARPNPET
jgi:regulator of protease activity HflC (stomatin/prohibitin superfamily)